MMDPQLRQLSVVFHDDRRPQEIICLDQQEPGDELPARILKKMLFYAFSYILYMQSNGCGNIPPWHPGVPWPFSSPPAGRTSPGSPSYPPRLCTPGS